MNWSWSLEDIARLQDFLAAHGLAGPELPLPIPIGDGHSNLTYRLDHAVRPVVLRRPPHPAPPPGANDIGREVRILTAVGATSLPVAHVVASGTAGSPFEFPFYIMELVEGDVITSALPARFADPASASRIGEVMIDMLAQLHALDWRALGLGDFGRPEGFNGRHLKRMAGILTDEMRAEHPAFSTVQSWLEANCPPESGAAILHNDFRIGNLMWSRQNDPKIAAIFDWELATIGDPLMDVAYLLASLPRDGVCRNPVQDLSAACLSPGFPDQARLVGRYRSVSGRSCDGLNWHLAMVNWKLAVLYAYSRARATDPYYAASTHVPRFLAEADRRIGA